MSIRTIAKKCYDALEAVWFSKLVYEGAPLVRLLDWAVGSECKYCMACRAFVAGVGITAPHWSGWVLVAGAVALTLLEKLAKEK